MKDDSKNTSLDRRKVLLGLASGALGAAALKAQAQTIAKPLDDRGGWEQTPPDPANLPPNVPPWMKTPGHALTAYGQPSPFESHVARVPTSSTPTELSSWNLTPLQHLHGTITPNGLHYERNHAGVPQINPVEHRLLIHGMVARPLELSMDELLRFPSVSRVHFIECSGNSQSEWHGPGGKTAQETHGLLSCAEWTGVPAAILLDEAGVDPHATWVLAEGADAAAMARSIPVAKLREDALFAYAQNGEMLRPSQGYPLRLLLPGYEGNTQIKWLRRLKFASAPFETYEETAYYTELMKNGKSKQFNFVMEAKSVITFPSGGHRLRQPGYHQIAGLAWSGRGRIRRVEVSADGGQRWQAAQLQDPVLPKALTRFRLDWHWDGSPTILQSRCVDETGYTQPTIAQLIAERGDNSHYHMNGIQSWKIGADGEVANVQT